MRWTARALLDLLALPEGARPHVERGVDAMALSGLGRIVVMPDPEAEGGLIPALVVGAFYVFFDLDEEAGVVTVLHITSTP